MEEYLDEERDGKLKGDGRILACAREVNMNFGHAKTKGFVMKRRTIG